MLGIHAMIGIGEGLLTAFALGFIRAVRPDILTGEAAPGQRSAGWIAGGLVIALALTLLAPLASLYADGLERVMQVLNPRAAQTAPFHLLTNYAIPGLNNGNLSTVLAGMIGVVVVFGAALILARFSKSGTDQHEQVGP
jgi:cobalt/nickel transport system permease protein